MKNIFESKSKIDHGNRSIVSRRKKEEKRKKAEKAEMVKKPEIIVPTPVTYEKKETVSNFGSEKALIGE